MSHEVHVADSTISFTCDEDYTILDAAERAGYAMPYSCRKGVCASCEGTLQSGSVTVGRNTIVVGPAQGVKFCIARAQSPITIAPVAIEPAAPPIRKTFQATVHQIDRPHDDIAILHLRLPIGRRAPFRAGQYMQVKLPSGETRNYSLANAPQDNASPVLHVRRLRGGLFSDHTVGTMRTGDKIAIEMPYGQFVLDSGSAPVVMLATGTGFAPVKSIIEDCARQAIERPVHLFWGAAAERDLYQADLARDWQDRLPWFRFTPVLSRPVAGWNGRTGYVQDAALDDYPDLRGSQVYACGNPVMIDRAYAVLTSRAGLPETAFHADAFVASGG